MGWCAVGEVQNVSSSRPDDAEQRLATAQQLYEDLQTYIAAGFTREEAMQWLCRTVVTVSQVPVKYPPEMYEFWERQNALALTLQDEFKDE